MDRYPKMPRLLNTVELAFFPYLINEENTLSCFKITIQHGDNLALNTNKAQLRGFAGTPYLVFVPV